jgi:hypothetical protein
MRTEDLDDGVSLSSIFGRAGRESEGTVEDEEMGDVPNDSVRGGDGEGQEEGTSTSGGSSLVRVASREREREREREEERRAVRRKLSHMSSGGAGGDDGVPRTSASTTTAVDHAERVGETIPGPKKTRVVVKDVAYVTYRACLYYVGVFSLLVACGANSG